jgi:hypothetical protein
MTMLEVEPDYISEEHLSSPQREKEIPEEWKEIWESWPEAGRNYLASTVDSGRLSPEIYKNVSVTFEVAEADETMPSRYNLERNKAAEADYYKRTVRFFPELNKETYSDELKQHIARHELGHFLAAHFIDPERYSEIVSKRPLWSNGKYIQELVQASQEDNQQLPAHILFEIVADDLADYLSLPKGDPDAVAVQLVLKRLARAGKKEALPHDEESMKLLYEEARELISFFESMLDPQRQENLETRMVASYQDIWLGNNVKSQEVPEVEEELAQPFIYPDPVTTGETYWERSPQATKSGTDPFANLLAELLSVKV